MGHSGAIDLDDQPPRIRWRVVALLFTLAFIVRFAYFYLDDLTRQESGTLFQRVIEEGTGSLTAALLFPLIVLAERRFPVTRGRWRRVWPAHLAAYVGFSAMHTTLIAVSRNALFPVFGQGRYDYGVMTVRYFMEAAQDVITYLTLIGILTLVRVQQHLRQRDRRAAELERDAANARLEALSLRLQPHFLFNALNTISSTVYDDPVAADEMIGRLGDLLRRALRTGEHHEVRLDDELETLRAYLSFVDARFGDRLTVRLDVDPAAHAAAVPALLLQPLVENAVRHGTTLERDHSDIQITIEQRSGALVLVVENDVETPPPAPRIGTGLSATRDRLRLLYGSASRLETSAERGRFRVTITLPARPGPALQTGVAEPEHARADR